MTTQTTKTSAKIKLPEFNSETPLVDQVRQCTSLLTGLITSFDAAISHEFYGAARPDHKEVDNVLQEFGVALLRMSCDFIYDLDVLAEGIDLLTSHSIDLENENE